MDRTIEDMSGVTESIKAFTADAGDIQRRDVAVPAAHDRVTEADIATGCLKHNENVAPAPKGRTPQGLSSREQMAPELRTKTGEPNTLVAKQSSNHRLASSSTVAASVSCCSGASRS